MLMKIAISGTYSTGKTTLSVALSLLTGIPVTRARTMREILPAVFPGYSLEQCGTSQLIELGIRRFTERIRAELVLNDAFISDGCALQEWLYGSTRMITGLNPAEKPENVRKWIENHPDEWNVFRQSIEAFSKVVKKHVRKNYDVIIHLPVEFPLVKDGHRPTSEIFQFLTKLFFLLLKCLPLPIVNEANSNHLEWVCHRRPVTSQQDGFITPNRFCPAGLIICSSRKYFIK